LALKARTHSPAELQHDLAAIRQPESVHGGQVSRGEHARGHRGAQMLAAPVTHSPLINIFQHSPPSLTCTEIYR